ncbi:MAG: hypothetical protein WCF04_01670 [Candidatus Nanopelagicales bacterium]
MAGRRARVAAGMFAGLMVLGGAGCGGDTTIATDDGTVTVDRDDIQIEVQSSDGTATISGSQGKLPEGWPSQIQIPPGGTISGAVAVAGEGKQGWTVSVTYPDTSPADLKGTVTSSMEGAGFESKGSFSTDEGSMDTFEGSGMVVSTLIGKDDSGSTLVLSVAMQD